MQTYETVLILKPAMSDPEVAEFSEKTKQTITADGGEIVSQEIWGRRKLTHMIGKAREGVYSYFKYRAGTATVKKLNHTFSISDNVIRNMTVVARDRKMRIKPKKAKAAPAAAASAQA
jgi:small subunit ribosomal protein S6